jgi:hypothetical protein
MHLRKIILVATAALLSISYSACKNDEKKKSESIIEDNTSSDGLSRKNTEDPKDSARKAFLAKDSAEAAQPEPR